MNTVTAGLGLLIGMIQAYDSFLLKSKASQIGKSVKVKIAFGVMETVFKVEYKTKILDSINIYYSTHRQVALSRVGLFGGKSFGPAMLSFVYEEQDSL